MRAWYFSTSFSNAFASPCPAANARAASSEVPAGTPPGRVMETSYRIRDDPARGGRQFATSVDGGTLRTGTTLVHHVVMRRVVVIATLACACAHRPSVRPASGWRELGSDHFVLATDAPEARARELLVELEDAHTALRAVSWHAAQGTAARIKVVAFYRPSDAEEVLGSSREGIFFRDLFGARGIVIQIGGGSFHKTLNHELAHQQLSEFVERAPRWLDEGLACYLETVRFVNGSEAVAGDPDRDRLRFADATADWNAILDTGENVLSMNE